MKFDAEYLERTRRSYWNPYLLKSLYEFLELDNKKRVLDVGCGTGFYSRLISRHFKEIVGVDIDEELLEKAKELTKEKNITYLKQNAYNLEFDDDEFDLVWCQTVLCNLEKPKKVLNEMIRVSKNTVAALEPCNSKQIMYVGEDPIIKDFYKLIRKAIHKFTENRGVDSDLGLKLPMMFYEHKLHNIQVLGYSIVDIYDGKEKETDIDILKQEIKDLEKFEQEPKPPLGSIVATPVFLVKGYKYV